MNDHHVGNLTCPACSGLLSMAKAEHNDKGRAPLHNDATVCGHCLIFLRYVETMEGLTLEVLERDEFESMAERYQAALLQSRGQLQSAGAGSMKESPPLGALLASEIMKLKQRVATLENNKCSCLYCRSGDGLNCIHRRQHEPRT